MRKLQNTQAGFGAIEVLSVLILVAVVAGIGVYINKDSPQTTNKVTTKSSVDTKTLSEKNSDDITAGWRQFTAKTGKFSVKYPDYMVFPRYGKNCDDDTLMIGPEVGAAGLCNSDAVGQIFITSVEGTNLETASPNAKEQSVTIAGATGQKYTETTVASDEPFAPPEGTKIINYQLFKNGRTYIANYRQLPGKPDVSADFELMINKTLKLE